MHHSYNKIVMCESREKGPYMAAAKDPVKRLAELDLEEEIIRDNYMCGVTNPRAVIIVVERLNEIQVEREFIQRKIKQDEEFARRKKLEISIPASRSSSKKPSHTITKSKRGAPKHGYIWPLMIQLFLLLTMVAVVLSIIYS